jgi:protease I
VATEPLKWYFVFGVIITLEARMFLVLFIFAMMTPLKADASKTILMPLPAYGFDPSESGIPWVYLTQAGHNVIFATPDGQPAQADIRMLTGKDLGLWKQILMNDKNGADAYVKMSQSSEFQNPISYAEIGSRKFDALLLTGGHDKGMRPYLESLVLQKLIAEFFENDLPVGAICHGTLLAARSVSHQSGKSVLWGRKTTGLTKRQEMTAYLMTKAYLGDYYRTYTTPMETELTTYLRSSEDYSAGPGFIVPAKRDSPSNLQAGYTVRDRNYLSARWPGDAHRFGAEFVKLLEEN